MEHRDMDANDQPELFAPSAQSADCGLFLELGKQKRKEIGRLKRGTGALTRQIEAAIERWRRQLGIDLGTEVVPVVLLYHRGEPGSIAIIRTDEPSGGPEDSGR